MVKNQGAFLIVSDSLIFRIGLSSNRLFWKLSRIPLIGFQVGCHRNAELRRFGISFEARFHFLVSGHTKWTTRQTDGTAKILIEIVPAGSVVDALHPAVAARLGQLENRIVGAFTDASFAHRTEIPYPEVCMLGFDG